MRQCERHRPVGCRVEERLRGARKQAPGEPGLWAEVLLSRFPTVGRRAYMQKFGGRGGTIRN